MRVVIVGMGAVGTALAYELQSKGGFKVAWRGRDNFVADERLVQGAGEMRRLRPCFVPGGRSRCNIVFVAVRAFDVIPALAKIPSYLEPGALIVTLNNGYLVDEIVKTAHERLSSFNLRIGVSSLASTAGPRHWTITNLKPEILFGPLAQQGQTADELQLCNEVGAVSWVQDPLPYVRRKWLANVVINGLCGWLNCSSNGQLQQWPAEVGAVTVEAYRYGERTWGSWLWSLEEVQAYIWDLIALTQANKNSLVRDLELGRQTEMEFLAGIVDDNLGSEFPWLTRLKSVGLSSRCQPKR